MMGWVEQLSRWNAFTSGISFKVEHLWWWNMEHKIILIKLIIEAAKEAKVAFK